MLMVKKKKSSVFKLTLKVKIPNTKGIRWALRLSVFKCEVQQSPERLHTKSGSLSHYTVKSGKNHHSDGAANRHTLSEV